MRHSPSVFLAVSVLTAGVGIVLLAGGVAKILSGRSAWKEASQRFLVVRRLGRGGDLISAWVPAAEVLLGGGLLILGPNRYVLLGSAALFLGFAMTLVIELVFGDSAGPCHCLGPQADEGGSISTWHPMGLAITSAFLIWSGFATVVEPTSLLTVRIPGLAPLESQTLFLTFVLALASLGVAITRKIGELRQRSNEEASSMIGIASTTELLRMYKESMPERTR